MKRYTGKIYALAVAIIVLLTLLSGCSNQAEVKNTETTGSEVKNTETTGVETTKEESLLPVKSPVTLRYWCPNGAPSIVSNYAEVAMYKELERRTGVKVEFIHPAQGQQTKEVFNVMIASGDIPDILESVYSNYTGGLQKAYADGVIVDLKPLMEKYAPNLMRLYKTYPEVNMEVETLDGQYFVVPWMKGSNAIRIQNGLIMRKDLLDELGLKVPENLQEFETALFAFKEKGVKIPFEASTADLLREAVAGAFGIEGGNGYLLENGKVTFWASSPKFKEYITTMANWYKQELLDPEFPVLTSSIKDARITSGETAVYFSSAGSGFLKYLEPGKKANPNFDLVGVPFLNPKFTQIDGFCSQNAGAVSIATSNKYKEITMAWIDYLFTEEGNLIANFGKEGESYTMENGYPKFTELITKNPEGLSMGEIGRKYVRSFGSGPFIQDKRYGEQFWALPQQKEALAAWSRSAEATIKDAHKVYGSLSPEESQSVATKLGDINTYVNEMLVKLIMGVEPLSKLDEFQAQLKKLGIDDIVKLRQDAHDKFLEKFPDAANPRNVELSDFFMK